MFSDPTINSVIALPQHPFFKNNTEMSLKNNTGSL